MSTRIYVYTHLNEYTYIRVYIIFEKMMYTRIWKYNIHYRCSAVASSTQLCNNFVVVVVVVVVVVKHSISSCLRTTFVVNFCSKIVKLLLPYIYTCIHSHTHIHTPHLHIHTHTHTHTHTHSPHLNVGYVCIYTYTHDICIAHI